MAQGEDSVGEQHDLNNFLDVTVTSSPKMGTDRESTQFTKIMTPLASKSFVLATPDNYEYFLSRYGIFSYLDAYNTTEDQYLDDDNVIYIFAIPDVRKKLAKNQDYFSVPQGDRGSNMPFMRAAYPTPRAAKPSPFGAQAERRQRWPNGFVASSMS